MRRLLSAFAALAWILLAVPQQASAHVLIRDQSSRTGALLHITPDDDPIAGQNTQLYFDIRDSKLAGSKATAVLTVSSQQGEVVTVPLRVSGASISARYTFPVQGLYQLDMVINQQGGRGMYRFHYSQRVSRGTGTDAQLSPAWADAGIIVTAGAITAVLIIAYNRRTIIRNYSKW